MILANKVYGGRLDPRLLLALVGAVASVSLHGEFVVAPVASLGLPDLIGAHSSAAMIIGSDGAFYGTTYDGGGGARGTVYKLSSGGSNLVVLHRFSGLGGDGAKVYGGVIEGSNGALYGTTGQGGLSNLGTIFRLNRDGSDYRILHSFTGSAGDGAQGFGGLIEGSNGLLYGTTRYGGGSNKGTVFRLDPDGANYQVLHNFTGTHAGGAEPVARVIEGPGGKLYGTTFGATIEGSVTNYGTVFSLNGDGTGHTVLRQFTGLNGDGASPYAELLVGQDGMLYGSTAFGGNKKQGVLFRMQPDGSGYQRLHSFESATGDGSIPYGPVVETAPGRLHGMTSFGGTNGVGIVYTLQSDGTGYQSLRSFVGDVVDGGVPYGGFVQDAEGTLYGTTWYGGPSDQGTVFSLRVDGSGYEVLRYFAGGGGDPVEPYAGLALGSDGDFYGTSWLGGTGNRGTVYRMRAGTGEIEVLYHFTGGANDGEKPYGGVIEASDGVLYGTTVQGGGENLGILYKVNKDGSGFGILRSFVSPSNGGFFPYAGLMEGSDGYLYGTTVSGGSAGYGTIFRIKRDGSGYSVFRNFQGGNDGANPYGGVIEGSDGLLYGVTAFGGGSDRGTVYRIRRGGGDFSVLRRFTGSEDGRNPYGRLLQGSDGVLYGTTSNGGRSDSGMVFRVARNGSDYRSLYQFDGTSAQGVNALGGLSFGPDGALYGTTALGGQWGQGTLFRLQPDGTGFVVQHHFRGEFGDGANPSGEPVYGNDGMLYGTARTGGIGCGTIYRLAPKVTLAFEPDGRVRLTGPTGFVYSVQGSIEATPAGPWKTITNVTMTSSPTHIQLPDYGMAPREFIRTVLGP